MLHEGLGFGHVGEHGQDKDEEEARDEGAEGFAHDGSARPEEEAQGDGQPDEVRELVERLGAGLGLGLGSLVHGGDPGRDIVLGDLIQSLVLESGGPGGGFRSLGLGQGGLLGGLGLVGGLLGGGILGVSGLLAEIQGVEGIGGPVAGRCQETLQALGEVLIGGADLFLGRRGLVPGYGLEGGLGGLLFHDPVVFRKIGVHGGRWPGHEQEEPHDEDQRPHPDGHPVLFGVQILERCFSAVNHDNVLVIRHSTLPLSCDGDERPVKKPGTEIKKPFVMLKKQHSLPIKA